MTIKPKKTDYYIDYDAMEAHTLRAISKGLSTPPEGSEVTQEMLEAARRKNFAVSIANAQKETTPRPRDSERGFAFAVHGRDRFKCQYCGLDGTQSLAAWLSLSFDYLLPQDHANRDNPEYIVTTCMVCNATAEDYFDDANDFSFDGKTAKELVTQKLSFIEKTREKYEQFWLKSVKPSVEDDEYGTDVEFVKPLRP